MGIVDFLIKASEQAGGPGEIRGRANDPAAATKLKFTGVLNRFQKKG